MIAPLVAPFEAIRREPSATPRWKCSVCAEPFPTASALCDHIVATVGKPHQLTIDKEVTP